MVVLYRRPPAAAGWRIQHGEIPAGKCGLLRDDRDSITQGAMVYTGGYGRIAVGGRNQRLDGAPVLGNGEPCRTATAFRRTDLAHRGWRSGRCAARRPGWRGEGGDVHAGRAGGQYGERPDHRRANVD